MESLRIWCITDDRPGHRAQLLGLVQALEERLRVAVTWLDVRAPTPLGRPDLVLAAGHRTHWRALRLKWARRAPLVVLMKPSLPRRLFDLCVVPEHDGLAPSPRVLVTRGVLSDIRPAFGADPGAGLVLLGGPSRHHHWSDDAVLAQLARLRELLPGIHWTVTTSRRTPASLAARLEGLQAPGLTVTPYPRTDRDWLRGALQRCATVWVTADSASMVYEALAAGASVGVLGVPGGGDSRVGRGVADLLARDVVIDLEHLAALGAMPPAKPPLDEAARVAQYIAQWLRPGPPSADENPAGSTQP